ncbi:MAG: protein-disulfide reductase DsbD N-terminal domain-containing protein, partial [Blastocatellia bacterium]
MSHRNHVGKVITGLTLLLTVLFIGALARMQAPLEDPPESVETGATPDPAKNQNPVSVSAKIDQSQLKPGQTAKLLITAKLGPGWHLYALTQPAPPRAAKITIDESGVFKLNGAVQQPKPKIYQDPNFSEPGKPPFMSQAFENEVTFTAPIKIARDAQAGAQKLIAKFSYQVCDDQTCLRPTTKTFEIETMIVAASVKAAPTLTPVAIPASAKPTTPEISKVIGQAPGKPDDPQILPPTPAAAPEVMNADKSTPPPVA